MSKPIIKLKVNIAKATVEAMYHASKADKNGVNGVYLDLVLFEKPHTFPDGKEVDGFVAQEIPKPMRDAGAKGPILGNWKRNL